LKRLIELVLLCFRSRDAKEVEILVLRHELVIRASNPVLGSNPVIGPGFVCSAGCSLASVGRCLW